MFRSMVATSLSISGARTGRVKMAAQYKGDGFSSATLGYNSPPIVADREWGYSGQIAPSIALYNSTGAFQVETATAAGAVATAGNVRVIVTAPLLGPAVTVDVPVLLGDSAATWAGKVRTALRKTRILNVHYAISGTGTSIVFTARRKAANETLNISLNANGTGITDAPTSVDTTPGVAGSLQGYSCDLETWNLVLNNPAAADGYRACSPYLVADVPESGALRTEYLCGQRDYMFEWTARLQTGDKALDWMNAGSDLVLDIPIFGKETSDFQTRITHNRARIIEAKPIIGDGNFINISGKASLMATSGAIGLTFTTINNVVSYLS